MLKECIKIFEKELERNPNLIIDDYRPEDGRYIIVEIKDRDWEVIDDFEILYNRKDKFIEGSINENYDYLKKLDYLSNYLDSNKSISDKKIHSSNYLSVSFNFKNINDTLIKNGKINKNADIEIRKKETYEALKSAISNYYETLKNLENKYKKRKEKNSIFLYKNIEEEIGEIDIELAEKIEDWLYENINSFDISIEKKGHTKFYFVFSDRKKTLDLYKKENKRYVGVNIFNKNGYNITVKGVMYGVPNNNVGFNEKKPYLENLSRKTPKLIYINVEEAIKQKLFFDYLYNCVNSGIYKLNFDIKNQKITTSEIRYGYQILISKDKEEAAINNFNIITYNDNYIKIELKEYIEERIKSEGKINFYKEYNDSYEFFKNLDKLYFEGHLMLKNKSIVNDNIFDNNELKSSKLRNILSYYGSKFINWKNFGQSKPLEQNIDKLIIDIIKIYLLDNGINSLIRKFNVYLSLCEYFGNRIAEDFMEIREILKGKIISRNEYCIESDEECLFAIGQISRYILINTKMGEKNLSFIQNLLYKNNATEIIKEFNILVNRYKHIFSVDKGMDRSGKLVSAIIQYDFDREKIDNKWIIAGFLDNCYIYIKNIELQNKEN